jgi:hypothetical protein
MEVQMKSSIKTGKTRLFVWEEIAYMPLPKNPRFLNRTGQRSGRLVVLGYAGKPRTAHLFWCKCDCGNLIRVQSGNLQNNHSLSCGCLKLEQFMERIVSHGMSRMPEFKIFCGIRKRCLNPKDKAYPRYGGSGIQCYFEDFQSFYDHMGPRPTPSHSVDRIDNEGHYELGNVRWATQKEQAQNRRTSRMIEYKGLIKCLKAWVEEFNLACNLNLSRETVHKRLKRGWNFERAVTTP